MEVIRKTHGTHGRILRRVISPYEDWPNLRRANHPPKNGNEDFEPETAREQSIWTGPPGFLSKTYPLYFFGGRGNSRLRVGRGRYV